MVYSVKEPEKKIALGKILRGAHYEKAGTMIMAEYFYDPDNENLDREFKGNLSKTYAYGAHGVEVEVDRESGKVKILKYIAAHDVGKAINPMLLEGQVMGSAAQALGGSLYEEFAYDENGQCLTASFQDYLVPTAMEVPGIRIGHVETPSPFTALGSKGAGESCSMSVPPALGNAIADAYPHAVSVAHSHDHADAHTHAHADEQHANIVTGEGQVSAT